MAIKVIQGNGFIITRKKYNKERNAGKGNINNKNCKNNNGIGGKVNKFQSEGKFLSKKECWQCGKQGHFQSECPTLINIEGNVD